MNIADRYQIEEVIAGQDESEWKSFTSDKNYSYVVDQQNGNYSNQVSWDLTSLVNQNSWMAIQEGYILMPFSSTIALGTAVLTLPTAFNQNRLALKNNFINFVDSIQLFVNGEQLVDQTSFSNMPINVMDMLTMSQDDLALEGEALNICPDTTTAIRYSGPAATINGDGYTANQYLTSANATTLTGLDYSTMNEGLKKRSLTTSLYPQATGSALNGWPPALGSTVNNFTQILAPYFSEANASSLAVQGTWNYVVYLPLKRLSDLLFKYPLVKGSQIRLTLNFNAGVTTVTTDTTATNALLKLTSYNATAGNTNPVMLTSNYINPITSTSTAGTMTITTKIQTQTVARVATTTAQKGYAALPNCRIYIPSYKVNPTYEERILSNRVQKIRYLDWYQQPIINVSNGGQFNQTLTTALTNTQILIILPFQNASGTNLFATSGAAGGQWQSPFDSAPATTMPGGMLAFQNFNVQVSGINVFNLNSNYSYDIWAQEVQRLGLNGALSKELSSGLMSQTSWNWSPYVIADISRRNENADKTYQSITVSGTNNSGVAVDYYCFIGYQKEVEVDVLTGAVKRVF